MFGVILPAVLALISALANPSAPPFGPVGSCLMAVVLKFGIPTELSAWWPAASSRPPSGVNSRTRFCFVLQKQV